MTPNTINPEMNAESHEELERASALLKILSLGNKEIEQGNFRDAEDVFSELDRRIAEDDSTPNDTVAWESIKAEAQARWLR